MNKDVRIWFTFELRGEPLHWIGPRLLRVNSIEVEGMPWAQAEAVALGMWYALTIVEGMPADLEVEAQPWVDTGEGVELDYTRHLTIKNGVPVYRKVETETT